MLHARTQTTNYESIISLLKNVVHKDSGTRSSLSKHEIKSLLAEIKNVSVFDMLYIEHQVRQQPKPVSNLVLNA